MFTPPADVDTPALLLDEAVLESNLAAMASAMGSATGAAVEGRGVVLRPHAKTHKSVEVARRQLAHGASGLTVATLGEAEVFADAGLTDLFIAYPLAATGPKARRLAGLAERTRLRVGFDSVEGARLLAAAVPGLDVLVEVDSGQHRTGVAPEAVGRLASAAEAAGVRVVGAFTHGGHAYAPGAAEAAAADERRALGAAVEQMRGAGLAADVASAGSTPTALRSAGGAVTEERPGIYPFYDAQQVSLGVASVEQVSLTVAATVVSIGADGRRVLDAGSKVLGADRPPWRDAHGILPGYPEVRLAWLGEHHGVVEVPDGARAPVYGEVVAVVPNHVCTVINLASEYLVVRDGAVVDEWPVDARARNR